MNTSQMRETGLKHIAAIGRQTGVFSKPGDFHAPNAYRADFMIFTDTPSQISSFAEGAPHVVWAKNAFISEQRRPFW